MGSKLLAALNLSLKHPISRILKAFIG